MELSQINLILQDLEEVSEYVKCPLCQKQNSALRIKLCGHYSCRNCFKNGVCPVCKIYCEEKDVSYNILVTKTENVLLNLNDLLFKAIKNREYNNTKENNNENTFMYQTKLYQVHFVDEQRVNSKGESPLHLACKKRKVIDVQNLLEKQVDINAQDFAGWVPLHEAIESGSLEIVKILLEHGALVDVAGEGYTSPLHKAVSSQNIDIIKLLLKNGANKDAIDFCGKKPIDTVLSGREKIEELFNTESALSNRIQHLFCRKKIAVFCYYIDSSFISKLKQHKITIEENYDPKKVTHFIIRKTHKISIKILTAMLDGCTIVPQEWIDDYIKGNYFIHIPEYSFIDLISLNRGIQKAVLNNLLRLPKLFDGINFYISGHNKTVVIQGIKVSKEVITNLIKSGGGKVLHRAPTPSICEQNINFPYHANKTNAKCCNYIIFEESNPPVLMYHMPELKHRSSVWIFKCIINFAILD